VIPPRLRRTLTVGGILLLLVGVPWLALLGPGTAWPGWLASAGTALSAALLVALPLLLMRGHGRARSDHAARVGDVLLGVVWVLVAWSTLGVLARVALAFAGLSGPMAARAVAVGVLVMGAGLLSWGFAEARRVPRVRAAEARLAGLDAGLDGLRLVAVSDTHFGPLDRALWSRRVVDRVNGLAPDLVCHLGDIADGQVDRRRAQAAPLAGVRAPLGRYFVTGNHEYFVDAPGWVRHLTELGWQHLHNEHVLVERGGARLVLAGIDDPTGLRSVPGHGPDLAAALAGVDATLPVVLLAHQPRHVVDAVAAGVDLQLSGHTHGGQIWPFHLLVRADQPVLAGLSRHGRRTQLYTSRGTGFWGPPFRIWAPSEITLITLRAATAAV
jgi:predicted MPP superfamily phosphohydrolase